MPGSSDCGAVPVSSVTLPPLLPADGDDVVDPEAPVPVLLDEPHAAIASTEPSATAAVRAVLNCLRISLLSES